MTTCSTHVLDSVLGRPAAGMDVELIAGDAVVARETTDADGRIRFADPVSGGPHRLTFATGPWFAAAARPTLYPSVDVVFDVLTAEDHYHLALLLGPYSYTTYRGS